jgi:antitoxin component HigA of HigAB toxin-antitoxin module
MNSNIDDVIWALHEIAGAWNEFEVKENTGLPEEQCQRIVEILEDTYERYMDLP